MKFDIFKTDDYYLITDDVEIKTGDIVLLIDKIYTVLHVDAKYCTILNLATNTKAGPLKSSCKKIIAHLPLDDTKALAGVDLLPEVKFVEDDVEQLGLDRAVDRRCYPNALQTHRLATEIISAVSYGFNTAREKYKHTTADVYKAIELARQKVTGIDKYSKEDIIKLLSQTGNPIGFIQEGKEASGLWTGKYIF